MRLATADAAATGRANRDGREKVAAGTVSESREFGHDLVESRVNVIGKLDFRDWPQTIDAHTDRRTDNAPLGNRRINDTVFTVLALQAVRTPEHAAEVTDVLAQDNHGRVPVHNDIVRGADCLDHVHLRHGLVLRQDFVKTATL